MALPVNTTLKGGTYEIKRFIASGGFGCTYEGVHTGLDKPVAIKEFFVKDFCNRDETSSEITVGVTSKTALFHKLRKKFVEEARALAKLNHPSIVSVSDVFDENGTSYYVMDYINGPSLKNIVDTQGPLSETDAVKYILQVADALEYVHKNNRLHLDVKPGNIMINAEGKAQLIDFGASKQYEEESGENTSTVAGFTVGYAPTEQMGNDIKTFTPATDVYSLGATLYNILSGIKPISAATISSGEKQKPLPTHISMVTRNAIEKAMQINKNLRPQSMAEFKELFEADDTVLPEKDNDDTIYVGTVEKPTEKSGKKGSNGSSGSNNSSSSSSRAKISEPKPESKHKTYPPKSGLKPIPKPKSKTDILCEDVAHRKRRAFILSKISGETVNVSEVDDNQYIDTLQRKILEKEKQKSKISLKKKILLGICNQSRFTRFICPLILGCGVALFAYNIWANQGTLDSDGRILWTFFFVTTLILFPIIIFWKKSDNLKIIKLGIICFILSIVNSMLLGMWNYSLVDAYYRLSFCLTFLSSFMISKKI